MTRRRYSANEKARAVGIAAVEGVTEAERQLGIPKETIHYWANQPAFAQLRTTARDKVVDEFWIGIQVGLREVVSGLQGEASLKEKAHALQVLADRHALLTGGATGRTESRDLTGTLSDGDIANAIRVAESIATGGRAPSETEGTPEG